MPTFDDEFDKKKTTITQTLNIKFHSNRKYDGRYHIQNFAVRIFLEPESDKSERTT